MVALLTAGGIGECVQRDEFPPVRLPYFLDNGAYRDWTAGVAFNAAEWAEAVAACRAFATPPDFVVTPDLVAQGWASLAFSLEHVSRLDGLRPYLVAQDGMEADPPRVTQALEKFSGLFVGGTLDWKRATAVLWVDVAHAAGKPCHVGRIGNANRLRWAREIGADSVDSCQPLWAMAYARAYVAAHKEQQTRWW